jgi:hypothetical protein
VGRSRKGSASSTQRRRWPRNLRLFLPLPLVFLSPFLLPPPFFPWFAGSARGGRRRQVGEEGEPLRRAASDRGPWMGPKPCAWLGGLP